MTAERCGSLALIILSAWDDIYLNRGLASTVNPWVWRIEFSAENVEGKQ